MEISHMEDRGTRQRRAYRAGWLNALRNRPNCSPKHGDAELDSRWSDGFCEGERLWQSWRSKKPLSPDGQAGFFRALVQSVFAILPALYRKFGSDRERRRLSAADR